MSSTVVYGDAKTSRKRTKQARRKGGTKTVGVAVFKLASLSNEAGETLRLTLYELDPVAADVNQPQDVVLGTIEGTVSEKKPKRGKPSKRADIAETGFTPPSLSAKERSGYQLTVRLAKTKAHPQLREWTLELPWAALRNEQDGKLEIGVAVDDGSGNQLTARQSTPVLLPWGGPALTCGVAVGELDHDRALLWAGFRRDLPGQARFILDPPPQGGQPPALTLDAQRDFTARAEVRLSAPGRHSFRVMFAEQAQGPEVELGRGSFSAAPPAGEEATLSFVFSGDSHYAPPLNAMCQHMAAREPQPSFFLYMGDCIYADRQYDRPPEQAVSPRMSVGYVGKKTATKARLKQYFSLHRALREDHTQLKQLLAEVPVYATWDDHEVFDDWRGTRTWGVGKPGVQAFFDFFPCQPAADGGLGLRYRRWGKFLHLFLLDTRWSRTNGTMLGTSQLQALEAKLTAVAKEPGYTVIATTVPLYYGSLQAYDTWARANYAAERRRLLAHIVKAGIRDVVFLTADQHSPAVHYHPLIVDPQAPDGLREQVTVATTRKGKPAQPNNEWRVLPDPARTHAALEAARRAQQPIHWIPEVQVGSISYVCHPNAPSRPNVDLTPVSGEQDVFTSKQGGTCFTQQNYSYGFAELLAPGEAGDPPRLRLTVYTYDQPNKPARNYRTRTIAGNLAPMCRLSCAKGRWTFEDLAGRRTVRLPG